MVDDCQLDKFVKVEPYMEMNINGKMICGQDKDWYIRIGNHNKPLGDKFIPNLD